MFKQLFMPVINRIMEVFDPGAVVLQCGADSLAADRLGSWALSIRGALRGNGSCSVLVLPPRRVHRASRVAKSATRLHSCHESAHRLCRRSSRVDASVLAHAPVSRRLRCSLLTASARLLQGTGRRCSTSRALGGRCW